MSKLPAIKLTKLNKSFNHLKAVNDISLSIEKGKIYALIGPNGAGKTTIVKLITGLLEPDSGTIEISGINLANDPIKAKSLIGYIPDDPFVYNYLTGREFLQLTGDLHSLKREESNKRINKLLGLFNLDQLIDGLFADYSRGNKQKTTIIAALLHQPKILIIDEPIVGLDVQSQKLTTRLLKDFAKKGGTILVCTHTLSVAQEIATTIGILVEGKLQQEGTLKDLQTLTHLTQANLEKLYLKLTGTKP